jgi:hypothetical protein
MSTLVRRLTVGVLIASGLLGGSGVVSAAPQDPGDTPARPAVSNMGLCSAFLGQLGARDDVNHLLKELGPFLPDGPFDNPGELYRIRAGQHPNASAEQECLRR